MEHAALAELIAAHAIDGLEPDERKRLDEHLGRCSLCASEFAAMQSVAATLAYAVPPVEPPPELRRRVLAAARQRETATPLARRLWRERRRPAVVRSSLLAAAAAAAVLVLALHAGQGTNRQPRATLAIGAAGVATLTIRNLPPAASGRVYEAWVSSRDGAPLPAGFLTPRGGTAVLLLARPVPVGGLVSVTVERDRRETSPHGGRMLEIRSS